MKTLSVLPGQEQIAELLGQARDEDVLVQLADGSAFLLAAIDEFELEVARTRRNEKLMALLDERARQPGSVSIDEVKQRLGL